MAENKQDETSSRNNSLPLMRYDARLYKGVIISEKSEIELIEQMEVRPDDIYVVTFPKSGTTLVQEMTYLVSTDLDFQTATERQLDDRFPFLDFCDPQLPYYRGVRYIEALESPRLIKSHLPLSLLPEQIQTVKPKMIYVARNPKDAFVSFYYFLRYLQEIDDSVTLEDILHAGMKNKLLCCPWLPHVLHFWEIRHQKNILFLKYEDIVKDLSGTVNQIAGFLGKTLTGDQVKKISEHCSFTSMKKNNCVNLTYMSKYRQVNTDNGHLVRKGQSGGWRNDLVKSDIWKKFDDNIKDKLAESGLVLENL